MLGLQDFTFREVWGPAMGLFCILVAWGYLALTSRKYADQRGRDRTGFGKKISFLLGLAFYYIAQGGPLNLLGHLDFSAHMTDMSLTYLIAPPMLLFGLPAWAYEPLGKLNGLKQIFHHASNPLVTIFLFNMLLSFYHIPMIFDYVMTHDGVHMFYHLVLMISALLMWWHVVCPVPELERLSDLQKMAYVFGNGVLLTPACALIIFANHPMYAVFTDPTMWAVSLGECVPGNAADLLQQFAGPAHYAILSPLEDQQAGGIIMKLIQEGMYAGILFYIFVKWYRRENPFNRQTVDEIPEHLLNQMESGKHDSEDEREGWPSVHSLKEV